ncbi:MAG: two-component system LytT family response regulator [Saprospiraceae bacterium]|jgi:two-component system LytT family response regulator
MKEVLIIDDESNARADLKSLINDHCPDLLLIGEADSVDSGVKLIQTLKPHAVFLDIAMQNGSGFDLLDQFDHNPFQVIFQTAFDEFAIKTFKYNAIDYLLKPVSIEELKKAADKITVEQNHSKITQQLSNLLRLAKKEHSKE